MSGAEERQKCVRERIGTRSKLQQRFKEVQQATEYRPTTTSNVQREATTSQTSDSLDFIQDYYNTILEKWPKYSMPLGEFLSEDDVCTNDLVEMLKLIQSTSDANFQLLKMRNEISRRNQYKDVHDVVDVNTFGERLKKIEMIHLHWLTIMENKDHIQNLFRYIDSCDGFSMQQDYCRNAIEDYELMATMIADTKTNLNNLSSIHDVVSSTEELKNISTTITKDASKILNCGSDLSQFTTTLLKFIEHMRHKPIINVLQMNDNNEGSLSSS